MCRKSQLEGPESAWNHETSEAWVGIGCCSQLFWEMPFFDLLNKLSGYEVSATQQTEPSPKDSLGFQVRALERWI